MNREEFRKVRDEADTAREELRRIIIDADAGGPVEHAILSAAHALALELRVLAIVIDLRGAAG